MYVMVVVVYCMMVVLANMKITRQNESSDEEEALEDVLVHGYCLRKSHTYLLECTDPSLCKWLCFIYEQAPTGLCLSLPVFPMPNAHHCEFPTHTHIHIGNFLDSKLKINESEKWTYSNQGLIV